MASFSVGDVVWVLMGRGDHEEPATVVELDCETDEGESGGGMTWSSCTLERAFFIYIFYYSRFDCRPTVLQLLAVLNISLSCTKLFDVELSVLSGVASNNIHLE